MSKLILTNEILTCVGEAVPFLVAIILDVSVASNTHQTKTCKYVQSLTSNPCNSICQSVSFNNSQTYSNKGLHVNNCDTLKLLLLL